MYTVNTEETRLCSCVAVGLNGDGNTIVYYFDGENICNGIVPLELTRQAEAKGEYPRYAYVDGKLFLKDETGDNLVDACMKDVIMGIGNDGGALLLKTNSNKISVARVRL